MHPYPLSPPASASIATLRTQLQTPGACHALVQRVLAAAQEPAAAHVFTTLFEPQALAAAQAADARRAAGAPALSALDGLPISVKDLFDIAGRTTLAGSVVRQGQPVALQDATSVARLRACGAAIVGLTNMTEFAFSGLGINPHHGTPRNPCDAAVARIPGGSSSGAAVSVALGLAVAALGSDTGGSIRIPAALCGIVGFKNTKSRTPAQGAFPLSTTLDTVCAMARSVQDCVLIDAVVSAAPLPVRPRSVRGLRLALPQTLLLDGLDTTVRAAFDRTLSRLSAAGAEIVELPLSEVTEIASISQPVALPAIEAYAVHREPLRAQRDRYDPRVTQRIEAGAKASAAEHAALLQRRQDWIARVQHQLLGFDALLCPTVPVVAPALAPLLADDAAFFATNALLLRNPAVINFLDGCAFSLPCHAAHELPVGLMLAAPGGHDAALAGVALAIEALLA